MSSQAGLTATAPINSRSSAIKTILLAAWRIKLNDEEWENRIRKILPRGVNGDVYDLADCLLKQALVGPVPNQLFISYLRHAVKCELVSHEAVLSSIAQQQSIIAPNNITRLVLSNQQQQQQQQQSKRTSPIICLLDFLKSFRDKISCSGTELECLNLCHSICSLNYWLLKCISNSIESMVGINDIGTNNSNQSFSNNNNGNHILYNNQNLAAIDIIDLCTEMIHYFIDRPFIKSLLFISRIEYSKEFDDILKLVVIIQQRFATSQSLQSIQDKIQHLNVLQQFLNAFNSRDQHPSVVAAQQLRFLQLHRIRSTQLTLGNNFEKKVHQSLLLYDSNTNYELFNALYSLVACDVILRPARSFKLLARQIATITDFKSAPIHMTYCELIRVCMIGFIDSNGSPAKVNWAFFTFLKMPKLLIELSKVFENIQRRNSASSLFNDGTNNSSKIMINTNQTVTPNNFIDDLSLAFDRLCEYSPLLDQAEYEGNCDIIKCIVKELIKNDPSLTQLRSMDFRKFSSKRINMNYITNNSNINNPVGGDMLLKTEPIVTNILQTLDSYGGGSSELFDILSQLVSGKQFEFALNAAASTGRMQLLLKKLIEHNELNKNPQDNNNNRALIFDITFLILTYIAHQYSSELMNFDHNNQQSNPQRTISTFFKWFHDYYNPATRINCPKEMLKNCDGEVVSRLIKMLLNTENGGFELNSLNWRDVCMNLPKAISEILLAWNQGQLSDSYITTVFEHIKSKMCFAAVVAATWLQAHIKTLHDTSKPKLLTLLYSLTRSSQNAKSSSKSEHYSERSSLMCSIIRKIYFELVPKTSNSQQNVTSANSTVAQVTTNCTSNNGTSLGATNSSDTDHESIDESAYQSINDKFISTLTAQEIFLANVEQCLSRGWIDHKALSSMNSLFKIIGSECWTNLIVEQILTSHESPSDLSKAVNITFGLFHLDIEACAFALLNDTIPSWLMGEKKQGLLNQPRAFALANLTVMTIIEVFSTLKCSQARNNMTNNPNRFQHADNDSRSAPNVNGIKREPGIAMDIEPAVNKRIKLSYDNDAPSNIDNSELSFNVNQEDVKKKLDVLNACIANLMRLFREIMSDKVMSQRTLFPLLFLQQTVVCTRDDSTIITVHLQPEILLDIINLFSSELTFELVLAISNLSSTNHRKYAAKAMCQLDQVKESKTFIESNSISDLFSTVKPSSSAQPSVSQNSRSGGTASMSTG